MNLRPTRALALLLLALPAAAQLPFNESFDAGSNVGGWNFGVAMTNPQSGGNPGAWMNGSVDTFAPQIRTSGSSVFTGDWRAKGVNSVGIDVTTISTQFPASRELSLILTNFNGTPLNPNDDCIVYFLGTRRVPQAGGGWETFDFAVDSASTTMPQGWKTLGTACVSPNGAWNSVLQNVDEVRFFFGNPENFFIFDIWNIGFDNARISDEVPLSSYCIAKTNSQGCKAAVNFSGTPSASNAAPFTIGANNAINNAFGLMFYGYGPNNGTILGGTLCVSSPITRTAAQFSGGSAMGTDCSGSFGLDFNAVIQGGGDPALVAGEAVFAQYWYRDTAGSFGSAVSDGAQFTIQP